MPNAAAALRTGFEPELVLVNLDKATGFPLEQYFWVWGILAVTVVVCAGASLRRARREPQMINSPSTDSVASGCGPGYRLRFHVVCRQAAEPVVFRR